MEQNDVTVDLLLLSDKSLSKKAQSVTFFEICNNRKIRILERTAVLDLNSTPANQLGDAKKCVRNVAESCRWRAQHAHTPTGPCH